MRTRLAALTVGLALSTSAIGAQTITFDPAFPGLPAGVTINYFANTAGFLTSMPTLDATPLTATGSAIPASGNALLLRNTGTSFPNFGALFSFAAPISFFSAVGNDFGGDPVFDNEIVYLTAFDFFGNVVATASNQTAYSLPNITPVNVSNASISHVAFTFGNELGYYSVDNIDTRPGTTAVPEPSTYAMFAAGLFALGVVARRRRSS